MHFYGILDRYIGKNIVVMVCLVAVCLTVFTGIITFIDKMRYIGRGDIDFLFVCKYVALLVPGFFVTFFPVAILIGGVIGLGGMARASEIVVLQSLGLSRINISVSCVKSLLPLMALVMAIGEYVVPPMQQYAENQYSVYASKGKMSVSKSGIWLKESNSFIGIQVMLTDGTLVNVHRYDVQGDRLVAHSHAQSATYHNGMWQMKNVVTVHFGERIETERKAQEIWNLSLNPERIDVIGNTGNNLTIKGLYDYIDYTEKNGGDSASYRLELYGKLMQPVIMIVMLFLALSTVFGPLRSMSMGTRILSGITLGFGYYVLNQVVAPFSLVYGIPPLIGASMASAVFGVLAVWLLRRRA
ncbi:MAG: LPS export ABC transporter permease LptG [Succinivibrio sp.]|jgi:lipopolysaccharide export system permease protein|nr:LPS export ABC transporter permease LptG [Succinivibrio sp.]